MYPIFERPKIQFELIVTFLLESKSTVWPIYIYIYIYIYLKRSFEKLKRNFSSSIHDITKLVKFCACVCVCLCASCYMHLLGLSYEEWYFRVEWWCDLILNLEWQGREQLYVIIWVIHSCSSRLLLRIWLLLLLPDRLVSLTVEGPCCIYGRGTHRCVVVFNFFLFNF